MLDSRSPRSSVLAALLAASLFAGALALGLWIVAHYPVIYYWDAYERIAHRDELIVRRWLPAFQVVVVVVTKLSSDLNVLRYVLAALSAAAVVAAFYFARTLGANRGAWLGAVWFATNRMFLEFATVPYQEPLFLIAAFTGLALFDSESRRARVLAFACLNVACLTRYEGWLLAVALAADSGWSARSNGPWIACVRAAKTFAASGGLAIALWLAFGTTGFLPDEVAVDRKLTAGYVFGAAREYGGFLVRHGGAATAVIGGLGLLAALRRWRSSAPVRRIALFLALDVAMVLAVDPFSGSRRVYVAIAVLALFAGRALDSFARWLSGIGSVALRVAAILAVVAGTAWQFQSSARAGLRDVEHHSSEPELVRAREAGLWLRGHGDGERVLASVDNDVQQLALATWSLVPLERIAFEHALTPPTGEPPTWLVELGGDSLAFEVHLQTLRGEHGLELVFEPHVGEPPRIYRVAR